MGSTSLTMASNGVFRVNIFLFLLLASSHGVRQRYGVRHGYGSMANMRNVAPYGTCSQSSIYTLFPSPDGNDCTAAINGNVNTTYTPGNCIHTAPEYPYTPGPFWKVTLDKEYNIHGISVYGRTERIDTLQRLTYVKVLIDDKEVYRFHGTNTPINPTEIWEGLPLLGRTVTLSRKNESYSLLNLCEVQIWVCKNGKHGKNCRDDCGHCADDQACNSITGSCPSGCQQGWKGPLCTAECEEGKHGRNCRDDCGHCADDQACNRITGSCPSGCQQGWKVPLCTECKEGKHGRNCMDDCGHCADGPACNRINGSCPSGCQQGWKKPLCKECKEGKHGRNCMDDCGHCADNQACNSITGSCPSGCQQGWKEPLCTECKEGKHGRNCRDDCGHCADDQACNSINGSCPSGCQQGWKEPLCTECKEGKHGRNCMDDCGHCADNQACNSITGSCPSGCQQGWKEPLCTECSSGSDKESVNTNALIGSVLGRALIIGICGIICGILLRRRFERSEETRQNKTKFNESDLNISSTSPRPEAPADREPRARALQSAQAQEQPYEIPEDLAVASVDVHPETSTTSDIRYPQSEADSTNPYDELAVLYHNTGDVHIYTAVN